MTKTFLYNLYGSQTTAFDAANATTTSAYDTAERLLTVTPPAGGAATYTYDALGRIATKTIGTSIDTYSYLGSTRTAWQIANTGGSGITTKSALDATGARTAVTGNALTGYLGFDLHGNTVLAENGAKVITDALRYDAWGELIASTTSALPTPWRYQGRLDVGPDASNPLYDFGARAYRPVTGAFTSLDSYAGQAIDPLSMNRFLYAEANPATFVDPDGHCARSGSFFGIDLFGSLGNCGAAVGGFVFGAGEQVVGLASGVVGALHDAPGHVADAGRCAADDSCRGGALRGAADVAGEIHRRGQNVLADPEGALRRTVSAVAFAAADWVGREHQTLSSDDGFTAGREAGQIFGGVEIAGLSTAAGPELASAAVGVAQKVGGAAATLADRAMFGSAARLFFSGKGTLAPAEAWAAEHGATTIGMTRLGAAINTIGGIPRIGQFLTRRIWPAASRLFAQGARGPVYTMINNPRADSIWLTIERDILTGLGSRVSIRPVGYLAK